jgi:hypothetical protein
MQSLLPDMRSQQVKQTTRDAARKYQRGERGEAKRELGELLFDVLEDTFPEAERSRTTRRSGRGFAAGVVVGVAAVLMLRRLTRGQSR